MAQTETPGEGFREGFVEADGFRIRYMEAGQGAPLVHLHGAGGMRLTPGHDLLSRDYRVIAFEMPGFGESPENTRTRTISDLAATMAAAVTTLGIDKFNLMGTSFGGKVALWLAVRQPERVMALILEAPAAIRPTSGTQAIASRRMTCSGWSAAGWAPSDVQRAWSAGPMARRPAYVTVTVRGRPSS